MKRISSYALLFSSLLCLATFNSAHAVDNQQKERAQARTDFVRLSDDGDIAFNYIASARSAIFNGDLKSAKTFLVSTKEELVRAQSDNTAFNRAEAALGEPAQPPSVAGAPQQVVWLPIHGDIKLHNDKHKTASDEAFIIAANHYLHSGNLGYAAELLHNNSISSDYVISAIPLGDTQNKINSALATLDKSPYQASQTLKAIQNSVSYETVPLTSEKTQRTKPHK